MAPIFREGVCMGVRVLVVEDDADINEVVATHLRRRGYTCEQAFSGTEARLLLERAPFDLVITDLMLPGMPGEQIVELIRHRGARTPIIVTSARTAPADKIDLLRLGADDYLAKPFDLDELVARIEVQLRHQARTKNTAANTPHAARESAIVVGAWRVDPVARTFGVNGADVPLTRIEFNIVALLASHPQRVYTKQELFEHAWGEPYAADDNTVNVHVSNIRAKLKPTGTADYLQTVWGLGFKLNVPNG